MCVPDMHLVRARLSRGAAKGRHEPPGDTVLYRTAEGAYVEAVVDQVDISVQPPQYGIRLPGARDLRFTEQHRLLSTQPPAAVAAAAAALRPLAPDLVAAWEAERTAAWLRVHDVISCPHPGCGALIMRARSPECLMCGDPALLHYGCRTCAAPDCADKRAAIARLRAGYPGPHISFGHLYCPLCRDSDPAAGSNLQAALGPVHLDHPALALALAPHLSLREAVAGAARQRLRLDAQLKADPALRPGGKYDGRPADFALERLLFYKCSKCAKPYFGGARACGAQAEDGEDGGGGGHRADELCHQGGVPGLRHVPGGAVSERLSTYWASKFDARVYLSTWFCGADYRLIRRDNVAELIAYGFWSEMEAAGLGPMLRQCVSALECAFRISLPPGHQPGLRCMYHLWEPLRTIYRPLTFYAATEALALLTQALLLAMGCSLSRQSTAVAEETAAAGGGAGRGLGMLVATAGLERCRLPKEGKEQEAGGTAPAPVLLLHGIGLGLLPYVNLIRQMLAAGLPLVAVEYKHVSMRLCSVIPSADDIALAAAALLSRLGVSGACVVAHSYGTFVASRLAQLRPDTLQSLALLDPVCFGMFMPHLLANFIYRQPRASSLSVWAKDVLFNFVSRDLHCAAALCRRFYWSDVNLWPQDLPGRTLVVMGARDHLVVDTLMFYAARIMFHPGHAHMQMLVDTAWMQQVVVEIRAMATAGSGAAGAHEPPRLGGSGGIRRAASSNLPPLLASRPRPRLLSTASTASAALGAAVATAGANAAADAAAELAPTSGSAILYSSPGRRGLPVAPVWRHGQATARPGAGGGRTHETCWAGGPPVCVDDTPSKPSDTAASYLLWY
eukprot:XP_001699974.1 predicted protein [Chlamydomonas reinhardtii]